MNERSIPAEINRRVLVPMGVTSAEPLPPGMSGAKVFRCQLPSGQLRLLKQWPPGTLPERVAEVDRVVTHSRENGCELTPRLFAIGPSGETCCLDQDACWQMMEWMPGEPLSADCDLGLIEQGARICAQQGRLSSRFGRIADIAREASFIARREGDLLVDARHVKLSVKQGRRRAEIPARRFKRLLAEGGLRIEVAGRVVGQMN